MADYLNGADGIGASGTVITAANSAGGGQAFTTVTPAGTAVVQSGAAYFGSVGFRFTPTASVAQYCDWVGLTGQGASFAWRAMVRIPVLNGSTSQVLTYLRGGATGGTGVAPLLVNTSGQLVLQSDGAGGTAIFTTTGALVANTWYRIECYGTSTGNAASGTVHLRVYADSTTTTPLATFTVDSTVANLSTTTIGTIRWGRAAALAGTNVIEMDGLSFRTGSATPFGPYLTNPTATITSPGPAAGASVEMDDVIILRGQEVDGSAAVNSRSWTQTAGPAISAFRYQDWIPSGDTFLVFSVPRVTTSTTITWTYAISASDGGADSQTISFTVLPPAEKQVVSGVLTPGSLNWADREVRDEFLCASGAVGEPVGPEWALNGLTWVQTNNTLRCQTAATSQASVSIALSNSQGRWKQFKRQDMDITVMWVPVQNPATGTHNFQLEANIDGTSNQYVWRAQSNGSGGYTVNLLRAVSGTVTSLIGGAQTSIAWNTAVGMKMRLRVVGNVVSGKIWVASSTEPTTWDYTVTDSGNPAAPAGWGGLTFYTGTDAVARQFDLERFVLRDVTYWPATAQEAAL